MSPRFGFLFGFVFWLEALLVLLSIVLVYPQCRLISFLLLTRTHCKKKIVQVFGSW